MPNPRRMSGSEERGSSTTRPKGLQIRWTAERGADRGEERTAGDGVGCAERTVTRHGCARRERVIWPSETATAKKPLGKARVWPLESPRADCVARKYVPLCEPTRTGSLHADACSCRPRYPPTSLPILIFLLCFPGLSFIFSMPIFVDQNLIQRGSSCVTLGWPLAECPLAEVLAAHFSDSNFRPETLSFLASYTIRASFVDAALYAIPDVTI